MNVDIDNLRKKELIFWSLLIVLGIISIILWLAYFGNKPQAFSDVIIGFTSNLGSNKSAERDMIYVLSVIGSILVIIYYNKYNTIKKQHISTVWKNFNDIDCGLLILLFFAVSGLINYVLYKNISTWLILLIPFSLLLIFKRDYFLPGSIFAISCVYCVCGLYRLYVFLGGSKDFSQLYVMATAVILFFCVLLLSLGLKKNIFYKAFMITQIFIPLSLLMFFAANYKYENRIINISIPLITKIFVWIFMILFVILAVFKIKNNWNNTDVSKIISYGTLCCIMNFNRYSGTGSIVSDDLHHPFENIITYSQTVEYGRFPFSDYIPVSGLYAYIQGFFFALFGKGKFSYYYVSENVFYFFVILLIVFLLYKQLDRRLVLIITLLIPVINYNRVIFIIPVFLLLSWDKLIDRKNLWLAAWFLTSLIHGLFYPLFGAAVCLGFLPFGIWQIYTYIKSGKLKEEYKTEKFVAIWALCAFLLIMCIPLLGGTLKHMLAMSKQTVFADGISRFAQIIPEEFLPYVDNMGIRLLLYHLLTFFSQILLVLVSAAMSMKLGKAYIDGKKIVMDSPRQFCICLSIGIICLVSFSYTIIRLEAESIYARASGFVYFACLALIFISGKYLNNKKNIILLSLLAVCFVAVSSGEGYDNIDTDSKLKAAYSVPEGIEYIEDDHKTRYGEAFIDPDTYDHILGEYSYVNELGRDNLFFGFGYFGEFYLSDVKGASVMETLTVRGYDAAKETNDTIKGKNVFVSGIHPLNNYYLYNRLLTSGDYIMISDKQMFYPNINVLSKEEVLEHNKQVEGFPSGVYIERIPSSWGESYNNLKNLFNETDTKCNIQSDEKASKIIFNDNVKGEECDFVYVALDVDTENYQYALLEDHTTQIYENPGFLEKMLMKKIYNYGKLVYISWTDDQNVNWNFVCDMERGKLLLPMGSFSGWLLNSHNEIDIYVVDTNGELVNPTIKDIEFLKLREVE